MFTQEQKNFSKDGATVIRGLFKDWVEPLREGVALNEKKPGEGFRDYTPGQNKGRFWADYCNWQNIKPFRDFVYNSPAAELIKILMQSERVRIFHEHVLVKDPNSAKKTPWHHDAPYYPVSAQQTLSLWVPLDPVSRNSAVEFVAGSHLWGKQFTPQMFTGEYYQHESTTEEMLPDIEANREEYTILGWDLEPGDAIAFDYRTIHGAPGNQSGEHARRVVSFRWLGDQAIYVNRGGKTSPPYPHLTHVLHTGDPLPVEDFPFVI